MADELDLETGSGNPEGGTGSRRQQRQKMRRERQAAEGGEKKSTSKPRGSRTDNEVKNQLVDVFRRIADQVEKRGDEELATALTEDGDKMAAAIASLTRTATFLRAPLLMVLNMVETFLAFFRVGGLLFERAIERRAVRLARREAAQADVQYEGPIDAEVVTP